jgi:hypothetical protein
MVWYDLEFFSSETNLLENLDVHKLIFTSLILLLRKYVRRNDS